MKKYIQNITLAAMTAVLLAGCGDTTHEVTENAAGADISESVEQSYVEAEGTQAAESTVSAASEESTDWFTSTLSEQDVTGQGFLGAKGEPYITDGDLITIPIYFNALNDGETARVTAEYGVFERIILDSGMNFVDKHWLEQDEKLEDGDTLRWYQSDDDVKLFYGTVWGHALIEDADGITGYAVFLLNVPKRGWSGSEIVREVRFDETVTEAQVLEEIDRVIEAYSANNEILECVTENVEGAAGENAEESDVVCFEMTQTLYDVDVTSMEELEDGQYLLKGTKMYPDIFLSDEQKEQLEQVGLMRGYLNGEEMFTITRKNGLFWFQWEDENEYRIVFRSTTENTHSEFSSLSWTPGDWVVRRPEYDFGNRPFSYGCLDEAFELTISADQNIAEVLATGYMTAKEIYEAYVESGNNWIPLIGVSTVRIRVSEEADGLEMERIVLP